MKSRHAILCIATILPTLSLSSRAYARGAYEAMACVAYPLSSHCPITCIFCHDRTTPPVEWNMFGEDLKEEVDPRLEDDELLTATQSILSASLEAIGSLDSDEDGWTNTQEFICGSLPGQEADVCVLTIPAPPAVPFVLGSVSFAFAKRPALRHRFGETSGQKLMRPELLNAVVQTSFGYDLQLCANEGVCEAGPTRDTIYLGGQDYDAVTQRVTRPTPMMPLVVSQRSQAFCAAIVANPTTHLGFSLPTSLADSAVNRATADLLYKAIWSRPAPTAVLDDAEDLLSLTTQAQPGWRAVCAFYLLTQGSLLLY